ncbi:hypothetical protein DFQ27_003384 [Actinomortierella ambigua]|uniref:Fe2OG dioxygenase domain-containing protein n=1 Tax=Actinomortierella ambigua TaxID=1343610 RepID=A0A9P6QKG9_9FUNG|nr:hypothetical protein DFQ27_003384 [Actinomortierella ambigua]
MVMAQPVHHNVSSNTRAFDPAWDFQLATLVSIFESTPEESLRQALVDAHGDAELAIQSLLVPSAIDHHGSNDRGPNSMSIPDDDDLPQSQRNPKRARLIQPRLESFLAPSNLGRDQTQYSSFSSSSSLQPQRQDPPHGSGSSASDLPSVHEFLQWNKAAESQSSTSPRVKPLFLYSPSEVAKHCPCTLMLNVLDKDLSIRLLTGLMEDAESWNRNRWWLFDRIVESPHTTAFFAEKDADMDEVSNWTYNGKAQDSPRRFTSEMTEARLVVRDLVNEHRKQRVIHPYEVQGDWDGNIAAVNHYAHSKEAVGWHADKLTYLGPRPTIASLTLGATRFFRIRKIIPDAKHPDTASQMINIALPHNSLLIMWPPMQEEWKHEVPPQATVTPHPVSGTSRINITYRLRRPEFTAENTPQCKCGVAMVLRCVFKNKANYGRYFYMCYAAGSQQGRSCGEFHWVDMQERIDAFWKANKNVTA